VVGLSGGPDSVALLDVLAALAPEIDLRIFAAHLDHNLREGSASDAAFCTTLCAELGVGLQVGSAKVRARAARDHGGLEEAARLERYAFLREVREQRGARAIVVAHTRDDQAETFLMRLLRGSGGSGLASMRLLSGDILRPFLEVSREQILAHIQERKLPFREDPTNADPAWIRNRVRHELLPYLELRFNPRIREVLSRTASLLLEEDRVLALEARRILPSCSTPDGDGLRLSREGLGRAPAALARRTLRLALEETGGLRGVGALHVEKILRLALAPSASGRRLPLPGNREAVFSFDTVLIGPRRKGPAAFVLPLPVPGRVVAPGGLAFTAVTTEGPLVSNPWEAVVSLEEGRALVVRNVRAGDRVLMKGKVRRLNRVFMEKRIPRDVRSGVPVVASGDRVVFVPGETLDLPGPGGRFVRIAAGAQ
jgi:tRNA(Ile)-lysidine synthase